MIQNDNEYTFTIDNDSIRSLVPFDLTDEECESIANDLDSRFEDFVSTWAKEWRVDHSEWIQTDDFQWQRKVGDTYEMYQIMKAPEWVERELWYAGGGEFELADYEDDILDNVQQFGYDDVADVKRIYGDHWERIVAECVFECNWADWDLRSFGTLKEAQTYIDKLMED